MTTFTHDHDESVKLDELDERTRRAWRMYTDSLRDLAGRAYEDAEHRSWARLQLRLAEVEDQRAELAKGHRRRRSDHRA